MGRKKEVLSVLNQLGIDYSELESGEILFNHENGRFWFHPDDSKPTYVTVNKINEIDTGMHNKSKLYNVINEINKSAPGVKALLIGNDVLLNCDLYSGRHRLCINDLSGALSQLQTAEKVMAKLLNDIAK